jgi:hypothetical protein
MRVLDPGRTLNCLCCATLQTGGPDGDLGSNEIKISKDKTIGVVDGSGVLVCATLRRELPAPEVRPQCDGMVGDQQECPDGLDATLRRCSMTPRA